LDAPARAPDAGIEFFERKIRPILVAHCMSATPRRQEGPRQLLLDSREGFERRVRGPAIHPGSGQELLIKAWRYTDPI